MQSGPNWIVYLKRIKRYPGAAAHLVQPAML
jgi:hypothetical protein